MAGELAVFQDHIRKVWHEGEPFKRWLAKVATERLQEEAELTLAEERLMKLYQKKGYADQWIHARLEKIRARSAVTIEWDLRGAKEGREFAQLTDTLSKGTFDITLQNIGKLRAYQPGRIFKIA